MDLKEKLVSKYKELLKKDNIEEIKSEIEEVTTAFKTFVKEDRAKKLEAFVADGDKPEFFELPIDEFDRAFEELNAKYNAIIRDIKDRNKREAEKNFDIKTELLSQLENIIQNEDVISEAFKNFKAIQVKWESVGDVPSEKYKELQHEFRRKTEEFYYHINIYKELKINDLKKNLEQKEDLIQRLSKLREETNIKEIEILHKAYLMEWDQIGPTFKENWEEIKARFYDLSHQLSDRVKDHYKGIREDQKVNLEKKRELVMRTLEIAKRKHEKSSDWAKSTELVKNLQAEWKKIGFATKSQNQKVWEEFREAANQFFELKSEFFKDVKGAQKKVKDVKLALIDEAKKIADIDDSDEHLNWKNYTQQIISLQKKWKAAGSTSRHDEQKLWKKFRSHADNFFQKKDAFFNGKEDRYKENLAKKDALVAELKKWKATKDKEADLKTIEEYNSKWAAIGYVPGKSKEKITKDFELAMDKAYEQLDMDKDQQIELAFKGKINQLLAQKDAVRSLREERSRLNERKSKQYNEQIQYENNLQFFSNAKGDNPLLKEARGKVERSKKNIEEIEFKIKLLNIEMNKLKKQESEEKNNLEEGE